VGQYRIRVEFAGLGQADGLAASILENFGGVHDNNSL